MSDAHEPIAFAEQLAFLEDSIKALAEEAIAVFRDDVPLFFLREARERFLADPGLADKLDDAALQALKNDLSEEGVRAAETLAARLSDPAPWLAGTDLDEPSGKLFEANDALWAEVNTVCADLERVLAKYEFPAGPDGRYDIVYKEPKRFISGHYLPSIAEKYWKRIAELKEVRARLDEVEEERRRSELLARWNRF